MQGKMQKRMTALIFAAALAGGRMPASCAAAETPAVQLPSAHAVCPLSGDKVNHKMFYEYKGKRYEFCCKVCLRKFRRNPEKYIAQIQAREENPDLPYDLAAMDSAVSAVKEKGKNR